MTNIIQYDEHNKHVLPVSCYQFNSASVDLSQLRDPHGSSDYDVHVCTSERELTEPDSSQSIEKLELELKSESELESESELKLKSDLKPQ
jgi:hypothetical protein